MEPISSDKWIEGYGPYWDAELERLLFVDVFNDTISCYDVKTKRSFEAVLPGNSLPTYVIKLKNQRHQYLVGNSRIAVVIEWNCRKGEVKFVRRVFKVEPEPRFIANSFHIAKASPNGKFFVGGTFRGALCVNISSPNASYYTYSQKTGVKRLDIPNLVTTGGVAFGPNGKKVYLVDLCNGLVWEYDFNSKTGDICKCFRCLRFLLRKLHFFLSKHCENIQTNEFSISAANGVIVFKYLKNFGGPLSCILGITSDTDGKLYLAIWDGGVVLKVNPR